MGDSKTIIGCLLGEMVGDSFGLPYEGLSRNRLEKLYPVRDNHRLLFGKGMISDDTEHACMTAFALSRADGDSDLFGKILGNEIKKWFLALPAGIGLATLRSCLKLLLGINFKKSGVFSAGNGPCMRAPVIGACFRDDLEKLLEFTKVSTVLTHSDPKAFFGAVTVAFAAKIASSGVDVTPAGFKKMLLEVPFQPDEEFITLLDKVIHGVENKLTPVEFAAQVLELGNGVSGYVYHTIPVVLFSWLRNQTDFENGIKEIISLGGDTDTTSAILGGIIGARVSREGIPDQWVSDIRDWPRTVSYVENLGQTLADKGQLKKNVSYLKCLIRNILFIGVVLAYGFRRLLPPY